MAELAKQHGNELGPTIESSGVAVGSMLPHGGGEVTAGEQLQQLRKNAAYSIQGDPPVMDWFFGKGTQSNPTRGSPSIQKTNLDNPGACPAPTGVP
jgi:hypothetical protein